MLNGFVPPLIVLAVVAAALLARRLALKAGRTADFAIIAALIVLAGGLELAMGRPLKYRNGPVRFWSGNVRSDQNSQQIADPYTFTHFTHGALFYGLTWLTMRPATVATRMIAAIGLESAWEVYENTETVVERYRKSTISLGYYGDSVINSAADILACLVGFLLAWRLPKTVTIAWVVAFEVMLAFWIRDNLTLNILMLIYPIKAVKSWQSASLGISSGFQVLGYDLRPPVRRRRRHGEQARAVPRGALADDSRGPRARRDRDGRGDRRSGGWRDPRVPLRLAGGR